MPRVWVQAEVREAAPGVRRWGALLRKTAARLHRMRLWWAPLVLTAASLALLTAAYQSTAFAEWYVHTVYPLLVRCVSGFWSVLPFSMGELTVYALAAAVIVFLVKLTRCLRRPMRRRRLIRRGALTLLWTLAVIFALYSLNCGVNYHRLPFSSYSGLSVRPSSVSELAALEAELIAETNELAGRVPTAADGTTVLSCPPHELSRRAASVMGNLGAQVPELAGYYPPTKPVLFSAGMSMLDITGVYFPPTIEANINVDVPAYNIAATACHELSHLRGFMREDEANFIAYLACRASGDDEFRYSGNMLALVHVRNALYSADSARAAELRETISPRVMNDFYQNSDYWKRFEGPVSTVSQAVNHTYLKANAQSDGVKSYGRIVDLLLADYRMRHGLD